MDTTCISPNWLRRWCLIIAALLVAASGCAGDSPQPVEGSLVWKDGSPAKELEGSLISFDLPEKQTNANGVVLADGTFKLTTSKENDGALAGDYKVVIVERRKAAAGSALAPGMMDVRYSNPSTTDLKATVKPGVNTITLTVDRAQR